MFPNSPKRVKVTHYNGESLLSSWGMWRCPGIGCGTLIRGVYGVDPELCVPCHNMAFLGVRDTYQASLQAALPAAEWGETLRVLLRQKLQEHWEILN